MKRWVTKSYQVDREKIVSRYHISEIMAEILVKRRLFDWQSMDAYLFPEMERLAAPEKMRDFMKTVEILEQKIQDKKKILIIGDYDVDGVMSAYILYQGIRGLGGEAKYRLPHRVKDGYGMRTYMVKEAWEQGIDTIITCDNGISAYEAVQEGKKLGMTILVTDHHEVPRANGVEKIPPADTVVNPKRGDCEYPFKELCGAGIVYRLMAVLWGRGGRRDAEIQLLPFAAIATVCDVVPLTGENRILVKNGLDILEECPNIGLHMLINKQNLNRKVQAGDLGFRIGPCLNAAGRLDDAVKGLELLLEREEERASERAEELVLLNEERKEYTLHAFEEAVKKIEERKGEEKVLVVFLENCHESVAGIVAGRIKEKYYRPSLVITRGEKGLKGSARSIPGYHMQREISKCEELLTEYGGHAMAAGFSLPEENLDAFRQKINSNCDLTEKELTESIFFDLEVPLAQVTEQTVTELEWLSPVGEKNPSAVFACRSLQVVSLMLCGKENQIARIQLKEGIRTFQAVDFQCELHLGPAVTERYGAQAWNQLKETGYLEGEIDILYRPKRNDRYGGIDFEIIDCR